MTDPTAPTDPTGAPEGRAPLGSLAEAEVPQHTLDPDGPAGATADPAAGGTAGGTASGAASGAPADAPLEDTTAYQLAAEDGAPLPAGTDEDPGAGDLAPEFRAPGED